MNDIDCLLDHFLRQMIKFDTLHILFLDIVAL